MTRRGRTPGGKWRWECKNGSGGREACYTTTDPTAPWRDQGSRPVVAVPDKQFDRTLRKTKRFIITTAQNGTPVHRKFFASLLRAKRRLDAELIVIPIRYKNPTSHWSMSAQNAEVWAKEVTRYLYNQRRRLNENLVLLGDIKVIPTAMEPLRGFEAISHGESAILGHTKVAMKAVPTPSHKLPKILTTTGACTVSNYTDSRQGALGEFHHSLGAVIVELEGKIFHLRHVHGNKTSGEFTDLNTTYHPAGFRPAPRPLALVMGDTHVDYIDPAVEKATFGKFGIIETLNPEVLVWHDLLDGYSVNPHHRDNPFLLATKQKMGLDDVRAEIQRAVKFVCGRTTGDRKSIVVASNHDDFVGRYMKTVNWKENLTNARFYFDTGQYLLEHSKIGIHGFSMPNPFAYWFKRIAAGDDSNVRVLHRDESYSRAGVELGMHGDIGPSGAKGSARNLRRIGTRSIVGHSHSPCIDEGCYQVGTSTSLRLEYNSGPSAWLNTHCILHHDGKRQLINIIDGNWRL